MCHLILSIIISSLLILSHIHRFFINTDVLCVSSNRFFLDFNALDFSSTQRIYSVYPITIYNMLTSHSSLCVMRPTPCVIVTGDSLVLPAKTVQLFLQTFRIGGMDRNLLRQYAPAFSQKTKLKATATVQKKCNNKMQQKRIRSSDQKASQGHRSSLQYHRPRNQSTHIDGTGGSSVPGEHAHRQG